MPKSQRNAHPRPQRTYSKPQYHVEQRYWSKAKEGMDNMLAALGLEFSHVSINPIGITILIQEPDHWPKIPNMTTTNIIGACDIFAA